MIHTCTLNCCYCLTLLILLRQPNRPRFVLSIYVFNCFEAVYEVYSMDAERIVRRTLECCVLPRKRKLRCCAGVDVKVIFSCVCMV